MTLNRAFFTNVGQTRRQGVDAGLEYKTPRWSAYAAFTYTDATYQSGFVEAAGSNPAADANGNITINPGDRLPGVPAYQGKLGLTYHVTDQWTLGGVLLAQSGQFLVGDEAESDAPAACLLHVESEQQLSGHAARPAICFGRKCHQ